jgi:hypothetical protein
LLSTRTEPRTWGESDRWRRIDPYNEGDTTTTESRMPNITPTMCQCHITGSLSRNLKINKTRELYGSFEGRDKGQGSRWRLKAKNHRFWLSEFCQVPFIVRLIRLIFWRIHSTFEDITAIVIT